MRGGLVLYRVRVRRPRRAQTLPASGTTSPSNRHGPSTSFLAKVSYGPAQAVLARHVGLVQPAQ